MSESRLQKSILNAKVNLLFYFVVLFLSFFSRKIFLDILGAEFVGLTSTLNNILSFLNLAELGVASAVAVVLYKPLFHRDIGEITEVISVFGYIYRRIGLIIAGGGILISLFLPFVFPDSGFSMWLIYFAYYSFLISSLLSYFFNYKQTLLAADQRGYVVTICSQLILIVKTLIQMALLYYTKNCYYWIAIELLFGILFSVVLNICIARTYPWLKPNIKNGKVLSQKHPLVIKYTKQLFVHKMGYFIQYQTKPLLIYVFVSLQTVAFYGNYALIVDKLILLLNSVLSSTGAAIGNLIAEGDVNRIQKVFWELSSLRFFLAGVLLFSLYHLINPFISLWLGNEYLLSNSFLIIFLSNVFILIVRGTVDQFLNGYGIFHDVWAPVVEIVISLGVSLIGGYYWGLNGVLLGSVVSMFLIVCLWKPYLLYRKGFKCRQTGYWLETLKQLGLIGCIALVSSFVLSFININPNKNYLNWILMACVTFGVYSLLSFATFYIAVKGFKELVERVIVKFRK